MALGLNNTVAPDWANKWSENLANVLSNLISIKVKTVVDTTVLPNPAQWTNRQIWCSDIGDGTGRILISNGENWIRTDTGGLI